MVVGNTIHVMWLVVFVFVSKDWKNCSNNKCIKNGV